MVESFFWGLAAGVGVTVIVGAIALVLYTSAWRPSI